MEAFNLLRKKARENRDKAIATALDDYANAIHRIAELEQELLGQRKPKHKPLSACVDSVLPPDRNFGVRDVLEALEVLDPKRIWPRRSVESYITRLRRRGIIRRVQRSRGTDPAAYVRVGVDAGELPFEQLTLPDAMHELLKASRPLNVAEISVKPLEGGYKTSMRARTLRKAVNAAFRRRPERFKRTMGKWAGA